MLLLIFLWIVAVYVIVFIMEKQRELSERRKFKHFNSFGSKAIVSDRIDFEQRNPLLIHTNHMYQRINEVVYSIPLTYYKQKNKKIPKKRMYASLILHLFFGGATMYRIIFQFRIFQLTCINCYILMFQL